MVLINQDRGICIFGRKRYGKTFLLKVILRELSAKYTIIVYNTNFEDFSDIKNENLGIFNPDPKRANQIDYLSGIIKKMRAADSNFVIVIIDLDKFFEGVGSQTIKADELKDIWGTGGHQRIMAIIESKAPKYLPTKVIDNNNLFYIGQYKDLDNQDRLKNYATRKELQSLDRHQFIEVDDWTGKRNLVEVKNGEIITIRELSDIGDANAGIRITGEQREETGAESDGAEDGSEDGSESGKPESEWQRRRRIKNEERQKEIKTKDGRTFTRSPKK